jgi:iron(III) transport system substrate-binding protein
MRNVKTGWRRGCLLLGTGVLLAVGITACGSSGGSNTLVLYNGQHTETTDALVSAFEHKTGIEVSVRTNDEDVLADQIVQEGANSPADLIFTENSPALEYLQGKNLLAPVDASTLSLVSSKDNSPDGDWVGVSARVSVLVYNTTMLKPSELPTSVLALAQPQWKGKLAIAPSETDFQPIVSAVAKAYGEQAALKWLEGIKTNGLTHEYADNETITSSVNSGQAELGLINQYYWYRLRAESGTAAMHSAIAFFPPRDPGYVEDISGAAILKSTQHLRQAQEFLAFIVSKQGQEIIAQGDSFEYPLFPGVAAADGQPPLASLQPYPITVAELGDGSFPVSLMTKVGLVT